METLASRETIEALARLGLTKNDSLVYFSLLELGRAGAGEVIKRSKLHSSRVHESLNRLIELGLISYVIGANRKLYQTENPKRLLEISRELLDEVSNILPELTKKWEKKEERTEAKIYEGYKGLRAFFDFILDELNSGEELLVFSAEKQSERLLGYFRFWNKRRIEKGVKMRIAFSEEAKKFILDTTEGKLVRYKAVPKEVFSVAVMHVFGNYVGIVLWIKEPVAFVIKSEEAADSFRNYFGILWKHKF